MVIGLHVYRDNEVKPIPLTDLDISELNVRRREITADLDDLIESLDRFGLQQPIVVTPKGNRFSIIIGQRRFLAAKHLGWEKIPALVREESLDEVEATIISFSENIQRRELSAGDKADACRLLMDRLGSVREVATNLGVSQRTVRKWLGYAGVPDYVKAFVQPGRLTVAQATRIASTIEDEDTAVAVARRLAEEPTKENQNRVLDSAEELPGRSASAIFRRAEERGFVREIFFELTESSARAMDDASQDKEIEANDLAREATVKWLQDNRYMR